MSTSNPHYLLATLREDQHEAIKTALCPGCQYMLPDSLENGVFSHSLPGVTKFHCFADAYRKARADVINEVEKKTPK